MQSIRVCTTWCWVGVSCVQALLLYFKPQWLLEKIYLQFYYLNLVSVLAV